MRSQERLDDSAEVGLARAGVVEKCSALRGGFGQRVVQQLFFVHRDPLVAKPALGLSRPLPCGDRDHSVGRETQSRITFSEQADARASPVSLLGRMPPGRRCEGAQGLRVATISGCLNHSGVGSKSSLSMEGKTAQASS